MKFRVNDLRFKSEAAERINEARAKGGRVIAVGTTTTRALESASTENRELVAR